VCISILVAESLVGAHARESETAERHLQAYPPLKRDFKVTVAIPASLVSDIPHLREKTSRIGLIGRALAMFRVDEVTIFPDHPGKRQRRDAELIAAILSYMEAPQYLRKHLFKIRRELRYVGILPPLRTPHHPLRNRKKDLKIGEYREGVVVSERHEGILVEVGVESPILVPNVQAAAGTRVTVKIAEKDENPSAQLADREEVDVYWGYKVRVSKVPFGHMLKENPFDLVVATSRRGEPLMKVADELLKAWRESRRVLIAFGSPTKGLQEIVAQEGLKLDELADFVVNTILNQATETVRTEEALYATLAALNLIATSGKTLSMYHIKRHASEP